MNSITFAGREEMLTAGLKNVSKKAHEYVNASKIYSDKEISALKSQLKNSEAIATAESRYTSPFMTTGNQAVVNNGNKENQLSYAISHGIPANEVAQKLNLLA